MHDAGGIGLNRQHMAHSMSAMTHPGLAIPLAAVLLMLTVPSVLAAWWGLRGTLTRGSRLGVHSPPAMASEQAFAVANRTAAPLSLAGGTVLATGVVLLLLTGAAVPVIWLIFAITLAGGLVFQVLAGRTGTLAATAAAPPPGRDTCCGDCGCGDRR